MYINNSNVVKKLSDIGNKNWLAEDVFYSVSENGTVIVWGSEGDEAIQFAARHPGTSGKDAATIAADIYFH